MRPQHIIRWGGDDGTWGLWTGDSAPLVKGAFAEAVPVLNGMIVLRIINPGDPFYLTAEAQFNVQPPPPDPSHLSVFHQPTEACH